MAMTVTDFAKHHMLNNVIEGTDSAVGGGTFQNLSMGLYASTVTLGASTAYADLVQPSFTGYAVVPVTFDTVFRNSKGEWKVTSNTCEFQATAGSPNDFVYGYFLCKTISSTPVLIAAETVAPIPIASIGDAVVIVAELKLPAADYGDGDVVSE